MSNTRMLAKKWFDRNYSGQSLGKYRASKYYANGRLWYFTLSVKDYIETSETGNVFLFLQCESNQEEFYFLKVPFSFFRENRGRLDVRETKDKFDLHISSDKNSWLICQRSKNKSVSFLQFQQ